MLLLVPLGANAVSFISGGMTHVLMIYSYFFVLLLPLSLIERRVCESVPTRRKIGASAVLLSFFLLYAGNAAFSHQLMLRRNLEYESTLSLLTRVLERADSIEGYEPGVTPVVFEGALFNSPLAMQRPGFERTSTFFGSDNLYAISTEYYAPYYIRQILGHSMNVDDSLIWSYGNREDVRRLPVYPAEGSIQMIDGVLVIHLGRQQLGE